MLEVANVDKTAVGGTISIASNSPIYKLVNSNMSTDARVGCVGRLRGAVCAQPRSRAAARGEPRA